MEGILTGKTMWLSRIYLLYRAYSAWLPLPYTLSFCRLLCIDVCTGQLVNYYKIWVNSISAGVFFLWWFVFTLHYTPAQMWTPVSALGRCIWLPPPIIHPACICRLEHRAISLTYSFSRETYAQSLHGNHTHTQTRTFPPLSWQQIPETQTRLLPVSSGCASYCVFVCESARNIWLWQMSQTHLNGLW